MPASLTTQNSRTRSVPLNLTGFAHGRSAGLSASEDTFRDKVQIRFQFGDNAPGHRKMVRLTQADSRGTPGQTDMSGSLLHRGIWRSLGAIARKNENGSVSYQGQVDRDQLQLHQTEDRWGGQQLRGHLGREHVDLVMRQEHGRIDVQGTVGRESVSLQGYNHAWADKVPVPGIMTAIAFSAYFSGRS